MTLNQKAIDKISAKYDCVVNNIYDLVDKSSFRDIPKCNVTCVDYAEIYGEIRGYLRLMNDLEIITESEFENLIEYFYKKTIGCNF